MLSMWRVVVRHSALRQPRFKPMTPVLIRGLATEQTWLDIAEQIKLDHDNVRDLFQRYRETQTLTERRKIASTLIREMSLHEDAKEATVYSHYADVGLEEAVKQNQAEHAEIEKKIRDVQESFKSGEYFDQSLNEAVNAFLEHTIEEETHHLPALRQMFTPEHNDHVARSFLKARGLVPKRLKPLTSKADTDAQTVAVGKHDRKQDTAGCTDLSMPTCRST